ncbi:MAG: glycosyltransferase family 1 protein [Verrucomicrobia bacterium]|nr:MAG: glycosyltransferase family 1 protein [Verrucomicrobiota bacterium]
MKLALVTETFPPAVNGVAMTLSRLVAGLRARGHTVEVVRPRQKHESGPSGDFIVPGLPIPFYSSLRIGMPSVARLEERWRAWQPDVVHVATEGPLGLASLSAAARTRIPVTSSFHTNFHAYGGHYGVAALRDATLAYLRWFHNRTRLTLAPTRQMVAELGAHRFQNLAVMARGVDTTLFDPAKRDLALRASWGAGPSDPVALYVGRVAAEKNLGVAVEGFLRLRAHEPRAKFVLVGDGPAREALARAHPDFHYAGMRRGEELAAHYASGDVFLFASVTETFGNVITEAMASGLVSLSYDYAATREHVRHGVNGFAARFGERVAFGDAVGQLWESRARWEEIRAAARHTALALTWDAVVARFESHVCSAARLS